MRKEEEFWQEVRESDQEKRKEGRTIETGGNRRGERRRVRGNE